MALCSAHGTMQCHSAMCYNVLIVLQGICSAYGQAYVGVTVKASSQRQINHIQVKYVRTELPNLGFCTKLDCFNVNVYVDGGDSDGDDDNGVGFQPTANKVLRPHCRPGTNIIKLFLP